MLCFQAYGRSISRNSCLESRWLTTPSMPFSVHRISISNYPPAKPGYVREHATCCPVHVALEGASLSVLPERTQFSPADLRPRPLCHRARPVSGAKKGPLGVRGWVVRRFLGSWWVVMVVVMVVIVSACCCGVLPCALCRHSENRF